MQHPSENSTLEDLRKELNDYREEILKNPSAFDDIRWNILVASFMKEYKQKYVNSNVISPPPPSVVMSGAIVGASKSAYQGTAYTPGQTVQTYPINIQSYPGVPNEEKDESEAEEALEFLFNQARAFLPNGDKSKYIPGGLTKAMRRAADVLGVDIDSGESEDTD